jgi:hypothetical protein
MSTENVNSDDPREYTRAMHEPARDEVGRVTVIRSFKRLPILASKAGRVFSSPLFLGFAFLEFLQLLIQHASKLHETGWRITENLDDPLPISGAQSDDRVLVLDSQLQLGG